MLDETHSTLLQDRQTQLESVVQENKETLAKLLKQKEAELEAVNKQQEGVRGRPTKAVATKRTKLERDIQALKEGKLPESNKSEKLVVVPLAERVGAIAANASHHVSKQSKPLVGGRGKTSNASAESDEDEADVDDEDLAGSIYYGVPRSVMEWW